jgi:hypothetical protein
MKIDGAIIAHLLKKVFLGGITEEAVVDFDKNEVQAIDPTNAVFLKVAEKPYQLKGKEVSIGRVGIGSPTLSMIIKHLETVKGEVEIKKENNRLVIGAKGRGEIKYLTVDEMFISTLVKEDNIEELIDPCLIVVNIPAQACVDFNTYMTLVKTKSAKFCYNHATKEVHVESGLESEHQFTVPFGSAEQLNEGTAPTGDFDVTVYGNHINQIFSVLEWVENDPPMILMAPGHPLLVVSQQENIWACLPLTESAGE